MLNIAIMLSLRLHVQLSQHPKYLNFSTTSSTLVFMNHWKDLAWVLKTGMWVCKLKHGFGEIDVPI